MNWNKIGGGLAVVLVIACAVALIGGKSWPQPRGSAYAQGQMPLSSATLVIEVKSGFHGSVWKFRDSNRECYFNSSGGIWCTR